MQKETNLKAFCLHVCSAENVINIFFGHRLQELTHLLLSLQGSHSGRYHRIICNQTEMIVCQIFAAPHFLTLSNYLLSENRLSHFLKKANKTSFFDSFIVTVNIFGFVRQNSLSEDHLQLQLIMYCKKCEFLRTESKTKDLD